MAETLDFLWIMLAAATLGACFGSFANMLIHRLPRGMEMVRLPSHCPACKTRLRWRNLIPLFSYLVQRARCHQCRVPIPMRYFVVELAAALSFMLVVGVHGVSPLAFVLCGVAVALIILVAVDLEHMLIPDTVQIALAVLGVLYAYYTHRSWVETAMGCAVGLGIALLLRQLMWWWKNCEGLGWGDVKFFAGAGLYITAPLLAPFCFLAGMAGIATALLSSDKEGGRFPFGPALALALFVSVLGGSAIEATLLHATDFLVEFWLVHVNN